MLSLRSRLFAIWLLSLAASVVVGARLWQLSQESTDATRGRAEDMLEHACGQLADRYAFYASGWNGPQPGRPDPQLAEDMTILTRLALAGLPEIRGGILREPAQADPPTLQSRLAALAVTQQTVTVDLNVHDGVSTVLLACPLPGPIANMAAWVATDIDAAPDNPALRTGAAVLMALMLSISVALIWLVTTMRMKVRKVQQALAQDSAGGLPYVRPTGEPQIDQIIEALNKAGERLRVAQLETSQAQAKAAAAQRLAALGRVAAGVAHEVRNPIATMRLRAEGALAIDPGLDAARAALRAHTALEAILRQIDRLERLSSELLAMTQPRQPISVRVDLQDFLAQLAADWPQVEMSTDIVGSSAPRLDADLTRRVLDTLLDNAARHTPPGTRVWLHLRATESEVEIRVIDNGPGVPEPLRASLFEPFVTSRADGTGLGLAIARELAQAQGGTLTLELSSQDDAVHGACFLLRLKQEG